MTTVSLSQLKTHLSRYIREVQRGGEVQVTDRGVPVARLAPIAPSVGRAPSDELRERLIREGIVRPASGDPADARATLVRAPVQVDADLTAAIDEDREDRF